MIDSSRGADWAKELGGTDRGSGRAHARRPFLPAAVERGRRNRPWRTPHGGQGSTRAAVGSSLSCALSRLRPATFSGRTGLQPGELLFCRCFVVRSATTGGWSPLSSWRTLVRSESLRSGGNRRQATGSPYRAQHRARRGRRRAAAQSPGRRAGSDSDTAVAARGRTWRYGLNHSLPVAGRDVNCAIAFRRIQD